MYNLLILFIIYLLIKNNKLKNENRELKQRLGIGEIVKEKKETIINNINPIPTQEMIINKEIKDKETKNTCILIVGAMLIIMSAIVFLMSTWDVINDLFKTLVLILLVFVFMGSSNIAKKKFNLIKTSKTFFYIGIAYIPIALLSISILGLFGDYLSITGEGKFIYLTASGLITALTYFILYIKNSDKALYYGSLLTQTITVILFSLIMESNLSLIAFNLLIYNILFILLTKNKEEDVEKLYYVIPYTSLLLILSGFISTTLFTPLACLMFVINLFIIDIKKDQLITGFFTGVGLNLIGTYFIKENIVTHEGLIHFITINFISITICLIFLKDLIKKNKYYIGILSTSFLLSNLLFFSSFDVSNIFLMPWIFALLALIMLVLILNIEPLRIVSKLIPIYFIVTGITALNAFDAPYCLCLIFAVLTFVIGQAIPLKDLKKDFFIPSHIYLLVIYLINYVFGIDEFSLYSLFPILIYAYSFFITKNPVFKYGTYISTNLFLNLVISNLEASDKALYLIPMIMVILITTFENKYKETKDKFSELFLSIMKIMAYTQIMYLDSILGIIATLGFTAFLIYDNRQNENRSNVIPLVGLTSIVFNSGVDSSVISIIMLLITIATTLLSFENKKINIYTIFSFIYLILTLKVLNTQYLNELLFIVWAYSNYYIITPEKDKDIFKFLTGVGLVSIYNLVINELKLDTYTAFSSLGFITLAIYTINTILKKYIQKTDIIEIIVMSLMYLIAFNEYSSETDGIIFVLLLCGIIILSYIKKYGILFIVTMLAIILNVILLTRAFWLSIPWWIYLLLIGSVLITFAIKNEADDTGLFKTIKGLKDKIEK